jgi:uncharacterized membrane protein YkoI
MFQGKRKLGAIVAATLVVTAIVGGAGAVVATGGDDDQPITGAALEKATDAALAHTGGGTVTETEIGDDGAAYSVEVRLDDSRQVEVNLDADFNVIGEEPDDDGAGDEDGANDD